VQAQAVLTLRIYHSVSLYDDSSLPPAADSRRAHREAGRDAYLRKRHQRCAPRRDRNALRALSAAQRRTDHSGAGFSTPRWWTFAAAAQPPTVATSRSPGKLMRVSSDRTAADGQGQTHHLPRQHAVVAGAQPDPERELEPGAGTRAGRRFADPQPDGQGRRPGERAIAAVAWHRRQRLAPLSGPTGAEQSEQRARPGRQP
jgi:hypothetical protein